MIICPKSSPTQSPSKKRSKAIRILLIGAGGLVGGNFLRCTARDPDVEVIPAFFSAIPNDHAQRGIRIDLADDPSIESALLAVDPECVVNLACLPASDCERSPDRARRVQVAGPRLLARLCRGRARLIHLSSDMVYSGEKGDPYISADRPDPTTEYGRSKRDGDEAIREVDGDHLILRSALVMGLPMIRGAGFLQWMLSNIEARRPFPLYTDQWRTPILVEDLAEIILQSAGNSLRGLYLCGGGTSASRIQMGEWLLNAMGVSSSLIQPAHAPTHRDLRLDSGPLWEALSARPSDLKTYFETIGKRMVSHGSAQ